MSADDELLADDTVEHNQSKEDKPELILQDEEMTGQLATFMFAGSETSA
jgi:cytochrome P450